MQASFGYKGRENSSTRHSGKIWRFVNYNLVENGSNSGILFGEAKDQRVSIR